MSGIYQSSYTGSEIDEAVSVAQGLKTENVIDSEFVSRIVANGASIADGMARILGCL